jgi:integrase/recombinase XerD
LIPQSAFTLELLDGFLIWLHGRGLTSRSIVRKLSSLSVFLKFLKIEGILESNPSYLLNRPKLAKSLPHYLSIEQVEALLDVFDTGTPIGTRDKALFELIYSAGLRVSEATSLTFHSLYFKERVIQVTAKERKSAISPWVSVR